MKCVRCSNESIIVSRSKLYNNLLCKKCISRHNSFKDITDHASSLKRKYGITIHQYYKLESEQNKSCKICNTHLDELRINFLAVDHCHKTNEIRGLLCINCNRGLGFFRDDIDNFKQAIKYLK